MSGTTRAERRGIVIGIAAASVFAVVLGVALGTITTFTHAQFAPWGLIAGLAIIAAFVAGLRLVFESRIVALAGALGVIAASIALTLPGAGGIVFALVGVSGWAWAVGPALLSAIVIVVRAPGARRERLARANRIQP